MHQLYFFSGSHCPSCPVVKKQLTEKINGNGKDINVKYVDVGDKEGAMLAAKFGVCSLPTILHMKNDIPVNTYMGTSAVDNLVEAGILH